MVSSDSLMASLKMHDAGRRRYPWFGKNTRGLGSHSIRPLIIRQLNFTRLNAVMHLQRVLAKSPHLGVTLAGVTTREALSCMAFIEADI